MIVLRNQKDDTINIYNLFTRPKHVIGRSGNLELEGDKSVSRQHATIDVIVRNKKVHIKLQDLGSKYGTYVNGSEIQIAQNTEILLKIGDTIKFGLQWNTWTIEESKLVVCASMLSPREKQSLIEYLKGLKGAVVSDWNDTCSYLTMNVIQSVTTNVFQALARVKPLVTLEYWSVLVDVLNSLDEEPLPNCDDYAPPILEPNLQNKPVDLSMNNDRRKLFSNKKFIACTSTQYNRILLVSHAGGTPVDGSRFIFKKEEIDKENIIVMECDSFNKRNLNLAKLFKFLEENNLRRIAEKEIGMSLILNSTDLYCNPSREPEFIDQQTESQIVIKDEEDASVLDGETQDLDEESSTQFFNTDSNKFSLTINDKSDDDDEDIQIIHDTPEDDEPVVQAPPAKKKRTDPFNQSNSKSIKMTDWVIRKTSAKPNISNEAPSQIVETFRRSTRNAQVEPPSQVVETFKKPSKNLFAFNRERKPVEKNSDSLFKTSNSSSSSSSSDNSDTSERRKRSIELFSSDVAAPPAKKANLDVKNLFQMPSTSKKTRTGSLILFESDSVDSASPKPSKVKTINETSNKENTPVAPKKEPLDLADSMRNKFKKEIKEESDDMTLDTKDIFNQSIILTMPLIKSCSQPHQSSNTTNGSAVNFKSFKKNNGINHTRVIPTNELVVYTMKLNLNDDPETRNNSDSD